MKKIIALSFSFCALSAMASDGFDGCYLLYRPGAVYPAFCIDGTLEEGINGSNVRMVIFETNSDKVLQCSSSSSSSYTHTTFEYFINEAREMTLTVSEVEDGRKMGTALIGRSELNFLQLDQDTSRRLLDKAYSAEGCNF